MKMRTKLNPTGFTLIEMAVVMTIIAVLAAIATYTYYAQIQRMRLNGDVRTVDQALQQAKMRALATGVPCGVVYWRRGGDDRTAAPDEFWVFMDSTGDNSYTDADNPCKGCKEDGTPIHCPGASAPECKDSATVETDYTDTHDLILDGPFVLEKGDYFTRIFGSRGPTKGDVQQYTDAGYEYILFGPLGGVVSPRTPAITRDRRIYLQNHPRQKDGLTADQAAIEMIFATGVSRVVPTGPAPPNAWK